MTVYEPDRLLAEIRPGRRFVLTTHVHPDGDGIGSEIAFARFLRARGADALIVNRDPVPALLSFLDPGGAIETYDPARHDAAIRDADVVVMLDNSDPQRLEDMAAPVRAARGLRACVDHHPDPDPFWDLLCVRLDAACTGLIVYDLMCRVQATIDEEIATALYTALSSDTGRFRFGNSSAEGFRMAAALVEAGASPAAIYARLGERMSAAYIGLFGDIIGTMEARADGRLVVLRVPAELVGRRGAAGEDLAEVINFALTLDSSRVAVLFRELAPAVTKVSLRSKGDLDVNRLARRYGGGGHRNASGIVMQAPMDETAARLLPELEDLAGS